ncbi:MAG: DNA (cytosine-5-)-methyltransferase, partial [Bacteroidota bacterium]
MKFIDLFAGLGGFHLALNNLGHRCVFASEIDPSLRTLYSDNFKMRVHGDIKEIYTADVPEHDILAAGFPCQAFSKAGNQSGLDDFHRGTLFDDIARILKYRRPKYFILENVANLEKHDDGRTWDIISNTLTKYLDYSIVHKKLSPHQFGIPQIRERIFIVGSKTSLDHFKWPEAEVTENMSIENILEDDADYKVLPDRETRCLEVWQEFIDRIPERIDLPSFPIWSM